MRYPNGIELYINKTKLTDEQFNYIADKYDVEYYAERQEFTLWIHADGYKPFERELFQYLFALKGVYNNKTKQDHLNLFIQSDAIDEFGVEIDGVKYKNIKASELGNYDLGNVLTERELNNLYTV